MSHHSPRRKQQDQAAGRKATGHRPRSPSPLRISRLFCRVAPPPRPAAAPDLHHRITREI